MEFNIETFNGVDLLVSEEEYLDFKVGDFYYYSGSKTGYNIINSEREAKLSNKQLKPKYFFEPYGNRFLVKIKTN